jgi:conjugal transfer pilus assembly protein TraE
MRLELFTDSFKALVAERQLSRYTGLALAGALLGAIILLFQKETVVVIVPPTLDERAEISASRATESFKKSYALFIAVLLGNVTPSTVNATVESMGLYLDPSIYNGIRQALSDSAEAIRSDGLSTTFSIRQIKYEHPTGKVFVTGESRTQSSLGRTEKGERTYEMIVGIRNYSPVITHFDVYSGPPRTIEEVQRMKAAGGKR